MLCRHCCYGCHYTTGRCRFWHGQEAALDSDLKGDSLGPSLLLGLPPTLGPTLTPTQILATTRHDQLPANCSSLLTQTRCEICWVHQGMIRSMRQEPRIHELDLDHHLPRLQNRQLCELGVHCPLCQLLRRQFLRPRHRYRPSICYQRWSFPKCCETLQPHLQLGAVELQLQSRATEFRHLQSQF